MKNIKLIIEYDGSRYDGWKVATTGKATTIQDKIESVLEKMLEKKTRNQQKNENHNPYPIIAHLTFFVQ